MKYAPYAFWFWDTALDTSLISEMAARMSAKGLNPVYIHPRKGLPKNQWLSKIWFDAFRTAINQTLRYGTYLGYCDEYWWPSGRADGRVLERFPELRAVSVRKPSQVPGSPP